MFRYSLELDLRSRLVLDTTSLLKALSLCVTHLQLLMHRHALGYFMDPKDCLLIFMHTTVKGDVDLKAGD